MNEDEFDLSYYDESIVRLSTHCEEPYERVKSLDHNGLPAGRKGIISCFPRDQRELVEKVVGAADWHKPHDLLLTVAMESRTPAVLPSYLFPNFLDRSRASAQHFKSIPDQFSLADYLVKLREAEILLIGQKLVGDDAVFPMSHVNSFDHFNIPQLLDLIIKHQLTIRACRDYGELAGRPNHNNRIIYDPLCCGNWIKDQKVNEYIGERVGDCRFVSPGPCPECAVQYRQFFGNVALFRE